MSHLTHVSIKFSSKSIMQKTANKMNWTLEGPMTFTNPYSEEKVENATIFKDSAGRVRMIVNGFGQPVVDSGPGGMGKEYEKFCQEYAAAYIKQTAGMDGATCVERGVDAKGNRLIEVTFN